MRSVTSLVTYFQCREPSALNLMVTRWPGRAAGVGAQGAGEAQPVALVDGLGAGVEVDDTAVTVS